MPSEKECNCKTPHLENLKINCTRSQAFKDKHCEKPSTTKVKKDGLPCSWGRRTTDSTIKGCGKDHRSLSMHARCGGFACRTARLKIERFLQSGNLIPVSRYAFKVPCHSQTHVFNCRRHFRKLLQLHTRNRQPYTTELLLNKSVFHRSRAPKLMEDVAEQKRVAKLFTKEFYDHLDESQKHRHCNVRWHWLTTRCASKNNSTRNYGEIVASTSLRDSRDTNSAMEISKHLKS